jgi:hypothetical protein
MEQLIGVNFDWNGSFDEGRPLRYHQQTLRTCKRGRDEPSEKTENVERYGGNRRLYQRGKIFVAMVGRSYMGKQI